MREPGPWTSLSIVLGITIAGTAIVVGLLFLAAWPCGGS